MEYKEIRTKEKGMLMCVACYEDNGEISLIIRKGKKTDKIDFFDFEELVNSLKA